MYWIRSLWPLLVFVIVFRVILVFYCSPVILIFALFYLLLGLLFVLCLIAFVCHLLIVLFSFVVCVIYSAKATDCLFKRTVSVGFSRLKFMDYLVGHGVPKHKL